MNGYFQLQRRFFSHWLWTEESRVFSKAEAFLDLLQLAAFTRTRRIVGGSVIQLEPGQVCGSERYLAGRWGWSTKKVRAYLTLLEAERMVGRQKKREGTILTLCNYEKYRAEFIAKEAPKNQEGSTEEAPRKQIEEGKEAIGEQANRAGTGKHEIPNLEAVKKYAANAPVPISVECAVAFFDQQEGGGWLMNNGHPIADWRAILRRYASRWNQHEQAKGGTPKHANSYQEDIDLKQL